MESYHGGSIPRKALQQAMRFAVNSSGGRRFAKDTAQVPYIITERRTLARRLNRLLHSIGSSSHVNLKFAT